MVQQMCPYLGGRIGAAWLSLLSIIKHSRFLSTKHERTNNKQPHRSDRKRERFSQPEAGLQGYMLYLIPRTPHRP